MFDRLDQLEVPLRRARPPALRPQHRHRPGELPQGLQGAPRPRADGREVPRVPQAQATASPTPRPCSPTPTRTSARWPRPSSPSSSRSWPPVEEELKVLLLPKDPERRQEHHHRAARRHRRRRGLAVCRRGLPHVPALRRAAPWKVEILSQTDSDVGGLKDITAIFEGDKVYSQMKYESGVHRVQRVPATETQGRVHTSAITVAVLPEAEEVDIKIENEGPAHRHVLLLRARADSR